MFPSYEVEPEQVAPKEELLSQKRKEVSSVPTQEDELE